MKMNKKLTKREKLLICTAFVTTCAAGYFGFKYLGDHKQIKKLTDETTTLMSAASEGLFNEALATVGRKIAYRKDKEEYLVEQLLVTPTDKQTQNALSRIHAELQVLLARQNKFLEAQALYEIVDEETI